MDKSKAEIQKIERIYEAAKTSYREARDHYSYARRRLMTDAGLAAETETYLDACKVFKAAFDAAYVDYIAPNREC